MSLNLACPNCERDMHDREVSTHCDSCGTLVAETCILVREVRQATLLDPAEYAESCCSCRPPQCRCTRDERFGGIIPCDWCERTEADL